MLFEITAMCPTAVAEVSQSRVNTRDLQSKSKFTPGPQGTGMKEKI